LRPLKQKKNIGYSSRYEGVIPIFLIENRVLRKNHKEVSKSPEKTRVGWKFLAISLSKFDRFPKTHVYSERGTFGASSYAKNSILIFFRTIEFSEGGEGLK
jgi:hypothetical protein